MAVIVIPSDYSEITHPGVIPICIADTDHRGRPIHREWVDYGVVPVVGALVEIADRLLSDKFRASEISEYAVHSLSRSRGKNLGEKPTVKVLNRARGHAFDLRYGGRRMRRKLDVQLFEATLDDLEEQYDFAADIEARETLDAIMEQADRLELTRVKELLPLMLQNTEGEELTRLFGQKRNTITTRFYRGMRRAAAAAGIYAE